MLLDGVKAGVHQSGRGRRRGKEVTTVEGLPARWAQHRAQAVRRKPCCTRSSGRGSRNRCRFAAFCQFGMMIKATELLGTESESLLDEDIKAAFTRLDLRPTFAGAEATRRSSMASGTRRR